MAFGKRGVQSTLATQPSFAAAASAADDAKIRSGFIRGLGDDEISDDFDINLGFMQPYGQDKSVIVMILFWFFLGGLGAHRFYLGHNTIGSAILAISLFFIISVFVAIFSGVVSVLKADLAAQPAWAWWAGVAIMLLLWFLIDGIYVICRMLSAKVGR